VSGVYLDPVIRQQSRAAARPMQVHDFVRRMKFRAGTQRAA